LLVWLEAAVRREEVLDPDAVVELDADAVSDRGDDFAAVATGVDVDAKRSLPVGQIDDASDLGRDLAGLCVGGY
jgi:hypothetical protein